jgi:DNA-binding NtrC family response regulator
LFPARAEPAASYEPLPLRRINDGDCGDHDEGFDSITGAVVEDDPIQREFLCDLLRNDNLDVIQCESAEAAELIVAGSGPELTLLVTDAALAGSGTGIELAQFAKRKFPRLNVILVSGQDGLTPPANVRFFRKPFQPAELLQAAMSAPL